MAACLFAAVDAPGAELAPELRIFEIRRANSDFSPLDGLSFRVETDGVGVAVSDWLATLARRIPDAYLAQLLTLRPAGAEGGWETIRQRDRRALRVRIGASGERFEAELALELSGSPVWTATVSGATEPDTTLIATGRDFELPVSRYLSWFREAGGRESRGELYRRLRQNTIFLALGITFRAPPTTNAADPVALTAPDDPRLLDLASSLVGEAAGTVRLQLDLGEGGFPEHIDLLETTFPEVTPRVLGIVGGWRFPEAAGQRGQLALRIAARN